MAGAVVSMKNETASEAGLTLPASSVAVAVNVCGPSARFTRPIDQVPLEPVGTVPSTVAPSETFTNEAGSAVPLISTDVPCAEPATGEVITGAAGAVVSSTMVNVRAAEAGLT